MSETGPYPAEAGDAEENARRREVSAMVETSQTESEQKTAERRHFGGRQPPSSFLGTYERALEGSASPRNAIKAFCAECCGYDREAVRTCPATACPLWRYRPWRP